MTTRLLSTNHVLRLYSSKNLRVFLQYFRCVSSQDSKENEHPKLSPKPAQVKSEPGIKWMNIRAGIFGPDDERLPLPGDIGTAKHLKRENELDIEFQKYRESAELLGRTFDSLLTKQESRLEDIRKNHLLYGDMKKSSSFDFQLEKSFECKIHVCPSLILKDCLTLFPDIDLKGQDVQILTFCQRTTNDMSVWSEHVENEREELTEQFIEGSENICKLFRQKGFWADFIDPCSGRPYSGAFTNATFFETDERYRYLGFTIEDLGCCKVISHRLWGTRIFVGALFTTAPIDIIEEVIEPINSNFQQ